MSGVSLEGTGDTPYKLTPPYINPYIHYLTNPTKTFKPLQLLTLSPTLVQNTNN